MPSKSVTNESDSVISLKKRTVDNTTRHWGREGDTNRVTYNMNAPDKKIQNGVIENYERSGLGQGEQSGKLKNGVECVASKTTLKALDESLGELYISLNYLNSLEKSQSRIPSFLPEETEYNELDKSLEDLDNEEEKEEEKPLEKNRESSQNGERKIRRAKPRDREGDNKMGDINSANKEVTRLSLKMNNIRPGTPTFRGTPSNHSDADSGIGTSTPTKRISDVMGSHFMRMNSDNDDDSLASPKILRGTPTRLLRSYNYDTEYSQRNTSSLRSNASLNIDRYLNRLTPNSELRISTGGSMRSLTIPMGSTDGRKIIKRSETSPEELLNLSVKPYEDDYSSRASFQRSLTGSFDDARSPRRAEWANRAQFILACVGYSVGLGNIWRFPYVCYKSGGGAFLVPYVLAFFVCGIPLLYMELAIGQLTRRGPIGALGKLCPILKGAGLSSVVISFIMSTYYNVIIAYTVYYLFSALNSKLPWSHCDSPWNTDNCWLPALTLEQNISKPDDSRTPSQEFYDNKVLQITSGLEVLGKFRWELVACLIVSWILVYFSIWKSVKSSGKVIYITATLPYIIILAFAVRSVTLEGAEVGLRYLFKPQWELLSDAKVWINAAGQVFNSIGLAFGTIISFASYKKPNKRILVDTVTVSAINAVTSLLVAVFAFAIIGNIATEQRTSVHDVITDGPGLVFVVYPEAMAKMPASQIWALLFFTMLFCLGLNSQFAIVEVVVTAIQDGFPNWIRKNFGGHEILVLVVCIVSFVFGLPNVFQGGIFFFQLIDHYAASISIMYLSFFELVAISLFYGCRRLRTGIKEMTGETPSIYFMFCWSIAAPTFIFAVWVFSLIDYEPPTYRNGEYKYPPWAEGLGWGITSLSLACIPVFAIYVYFSAKGKNFYEKIRNSVKPRLYVCDICNEEICEHFLRDRERELDNLLTEKESPTIIGH